MRGLACQRIQCDEIWSFVGAKDKNLTDEERATGEVGSMWTWTPIDADTKLIVSYLVGGRDAGYACAFMNDVAQRLTSRVQLTMDAHKAYLATVDDAFGDNIDYAMLVKLYGPEPAGAGRYSPPACIGAELRPITGKPDLAHVSTSYVERQNLTMRMHMRRFTRLTNAFSKKVENLEHAVALHFMYYNFRRIHQTLRVTPAMAAGIADHAWDLAELVALMPEPTVAAWGSRTGRAKSK